MYLMLADKPILEFDFDKNIYNVIEPDLLPFFLRGAIHETTPEMPENQKQDIYKNNSNKIIDFLSRRVISLDRRNAKKLLNAFHLSQSQDPITKAKIAVTCRAASIIDNYWLNDDELSLDWNEMNLKKCHLNKIATQIMLWGKSLTTTDIYHTPELTGKGTYPQAWVRQKNTLYLYKKGLNNGKETEIEVSVSKILDCFNVNHVEYKLGILSNKEIETQSKERYSRCENLSTEDYCIVSAEDIYSYCSQNNIDYESFIMQQDADAINKMNIIDYLISNSDRHGLNWGFYMSNATGHLLGCHPLFDHNRAFDETQMQDISGGDCLVFSGTKQEIAHKAIKKCNFVCTKPVTREMFLNNQMYESFMARAVELGLYKKQEKNFKQLIGLEKYQKYVPIKLYPYLKVKNTIQDRFLEYPKKVY